MRRVSTFLPLCLALVSCEKPSGCADVILDREPPPKAEKQVRAPYHEEFGQKARGFVDWLSADGRYVVLYRFLADTNGDGEITVRLGEHGEVLGDDPIVEVHDLVNGTFDAVDEVIATGPRQRLYVIRNGDKIVLVNAATRQEVELPADSAGDEQNPCLPARQAVFGPAGERVAFPTPDGAGSTFDVVSSELRRFETSDKLWRVGAPPLERSIILQTIPKDTDGDGEVAPPTAKTTCSSRWASRFASSMGSYGWKGDDYRSVMVWPDGTRTEFEGNLIPVGPSLTWSPNGGLRNLSGERVEVRRGCALASVPLGTTTLLLQCGPHLAVWNVDESEPQMLEQKARPVESVSVPARPDGSQAWVAVTVDAPDGERVGRLDLESGTLDLGPAARIAGSPHPSGWLLATTPNGKLASFNLLTGEENPEIDIAGTNPRQLSVRVGKNWRTVDPVTGASLELDEQPKWMSASGCVITATDSDGRLDVGPWRRRCP